MKDRWIVLAFGWLGMGNLFPWNAFITVSTFFESRLKDSRFENTFESSFGLAYNAVNLFTLCVLLVIQQFLTQKQLIIFPFTIVGVVFLVMTFMTLINTSADVLFWVSMGGAIVNGMMAAPLISIVITISTQYSPIHASAALAGQAIAGLATSLTNVATIASVPLRSDFCNSSAAVNLQLSNSNGKFKVDWSAFMYFVVASLVCFSCVVVYVLLPRRETVDHLAPASDPDEYSIVDQDPTLYIPPSSRGSTIVAAIIEDENVNMRYNIQDDLMATRDSDLESYEYNSRHFNNLPPYESWDSYTIKQVARIVFIPSLATGMTFFVTLAIFPSITAITQSMNQCKPGASRFNNDLFVPILFVVFNLGDFLGRVCQAYYQPFRGKQLLMLSLMRFLLWPMFLLCNVKDGRYNALFGHDAYPIVFTALCGLTNGYLATAGIVFASRLVPRYHRDLGSIITVLTLTLGLTLGCLVSYKAVNIVVNK